MQELQAQCTYLTHKSYGALREGWSDQPPVPAVIACDIIIFEAVRASYSLFPGTLVATF